ncbi:MULTISPECIES: hypothetical protein [unclassified Vibrio]|uniref:hypothetical protein n=1 Tax=unclassified Vibrio TaxID=2614977 RepID=UPI00159E1064|nr:MULTISPECIES: hypothetical protein [unclassified Vibrio]
MLFETCNKILNTIGLDNDEQTIPDETTKDRTSFLNHVTRHYQEGGTTELGIYRGKRK